MPITTIDSLTALSNFGKNPVARWPSKEQAGNRLETLAAPAFDATFRIGPAAKIVSFGACFARQIASSLEGRGFDVPTRWLGDADTDDTDIGRLTYYTYGVPAIFNEIAWAFGEVPYEPRLHVVEVRPGLYADMHLARNLPLEPLDRIVARRERLFDATRSLMTADVLIITLGRAEVWFDHEAENYLNVRPPDLAIRRDPGRFSCHVLSYDELRRFLKQTFDIVFRRCQPKLRVLLGVSPVPQSTTSVDCDVVVANSYAKSVLRAVSEKIVKSSGRIDYLPCYESVLLSDRDLAFEDDQVHVRPAFVDHIVCGMLAAYTDASSSKRTIDLGARDRPTREQTATLKRAKDGLRRKRYAEAFNTAETIRHGACEAAALRIQATAKLRMGKADEAAGLARAGLAVRHNEPGLHALLAEALVALKRLEEAESHLQRALNYIPDQARWLTMLDKLQGNLMLERTSAARRSPPNETIFLPASASASKMMVQDRTHQPAVAKPVVIARRSEPAVLDYAVPASVAATTDATLIEASAPGRRRIVFHVGLPHSGTKLFQKFCHHQRRFLGRNGVDYLRSAMGYGHRHSPLVASYIAHRPAGPTVAFRWRSREETVLAIKKEIAKSRSQTTLISSEHFSMHFDGAEAQALAADFSDYDCTIVLVIRDMYARLVSGFERHVAASGCLTFEQYARSVLAEGTRHLSVRETIKVWEEAFGHAQMRLIDYDATVDVTAAILGVCGIRAALPEDAAARRSASLAPEALRILREANVLIAARQAIAMDKATVAWLQHYFFSGRCRRRLMRYAGGAGWTLSAKAMKMLDRVALADQRFIIETYRIAPRGDGTRARLTICDQPPDETEEARRAQRLVASVTRGLWTPSAGLTHAAFWCNTVFKRIASGLPRTGNGLAAESVSQSPKLH